MTGHRQLPAGHTLDECLADVMAGRTTVTEAADVLTGPAEYEWSDDSALWQLQHGEAGTPRTESAVVHLEVSINGESGTEELRDIALRLLGIAERTP